MTRDQLIAETRRLVAEGERLQAQPSLAALRTWLQLSDALLSSAWGSMDRYHLVWLSVGRPKEIVRGRPMVPAEAAAYVREVAEQKTAALRMSLDAVERQRMPFLGEQGAIGRGQGLGEVPGESAPGGEAQAAGDVAASAGQTARIEQPGEAPAIGAARPRRGRPPAGGDTPRGRITPPSGESPARGDVAARGGTGVAAPGPGRARGPGR